jgi:hypothetical protein
MKIFELFNQCNPSDMKIHFAVTNQKNINPLEVFKASQDRFTIYQNRQTRQNFSRKYILSLIQTENKVDWLFAGIYHVEGDPVKKGDLYFYETKLTDLYNDLIGRLIVNFKKPFRASYPYAENVKNITVLSIREERLSVSDFKSFHETNLSRFELETIFKYQAKDWKAALSSVAAIYLLTDYTNNKLYVGSAYKTKYDGNGSLWNRWETYNNSYHGGNKRLKKLFKEQSEEGFANFQYSILETFVLYISLSQITSRESEWKKRLRSIETGYNDN